MFKFCNNYVKNLFLFLLGGFSYVAIEIGYRGYSHISMLIAGGIGFVFMGLLNNLVSWQLPLMIQMFLSTLFVTVIELVIGMVVNVWLGLNVWDYSNLPFNYMGQVCLLFSLIWFFLSLPAIVLNGYLRYWLLDEKKPSYRLF